MTTAEEFVSKAYDLRRNGDRNSSLEVYWEACRAFQGNDRGRAHCLRHIGDIALELGRSDEARAALHDAEALYRSSVHDTLSLANTLRLRAQMEGDKNLWREARALYEQAAREAGLDLGPAFAECDSHLA